MASRRTPTFANEPKEALAFYQEYGYVIEPQVWAPEEREQILRASEDLPSFQDGTGTIVMNPHCLDPVYLQALRKPRVVKIMELLLSGPVSGIQTQFFFCKPGTPGFARHQDNFYVAAKPDAFASAWLPLVDVSAANGTLVIYPGSHKEGLFAVEPVPGIEERRDKNSLSQQVVVPDQYKPVDVVASAGDVVLIHAHLIHSSHKNASRDYRRVLLCTYIRSGESFRPGFNARRSEVDVYSQDPLPVTRAAVA